MSKLTITREAGQSVMIGDNIVVTLVAIRRGQARLTIDAPEEIKILREELIDRDLNKLFSEKR